MLLETMPCRACYQNVDGALGFCHTLRGPGRQRQSSVTRVSAVDYLECIEAVLAMLCSERRFPNNLSICLRPHSWPVSRSRRITLVATSIVQHWALDLANLVNTHPKCGG